MQEGTKYSSPVRPPASNPPAAESRLSLRGIWQLLGRYDLAKWGPFIALLLLFVISTLASPYFLMTRNLLNVSRQVALNGIVSVGMTFVILTGGIDLSVGAVVALASTVMALTQGQGFFALIIALAAGVIVGLLNGGLVTGLRAQPFVITLGMMVAIRGTALTLSGGHRIEGVPAMFRFMGIGSVGGVPVQSLLFLGVAAIAIFVLQRMTFGRAVYAVGANEAAAKLSGILSGRTKILVYVISGLLAAFTGAVTAAYLNVGDSAFHGLNAELDAIAAVAIGGASLNGGKGTMLGTVAGVLIIGIITNLLNLRNVPGEAQYVVKGAIIIGAVAIQQVRRR
jgi:ribose/xylose/arabinose/galactoside ABC-type transport system permease subunit